MCLLQSYVFQLLSVYSTPICVFQPCGLLSLYSNPWIVGRKTKRMESSSKRKESHSYGKNGRKQRVTFTGWESGIGIKPQILRFLPPLSFVTYWYKSYWYQFGLWSQFSSHRSQQVNKVTIVQLFQEYQESDDKNTRNRSDKKEDR